MKSIKALIIFIICLSSLFTPLAALADNNNPSPWGEILNPDGTVKWNNLTDLGTTSQPVPWMALNLPGNLKVNLDATYHRYQTPSGNVVVLPSPVTLFFMALHPRESNLGGANSMLGNGVAILTMLVGPMTPAMLAQIAQKGYTDPKLFFQAVIDGKENVWSVLQLNFLYELTKMTFDSHFLVDALLLYTNGITNCASLPGGCAGIVQVPNTTIPTTNNCPKPSVSQKPAVLEIQKLAPEKPLVVGQDPAKRGVDIQASVTIPPVLFTWYEEQKDASSCEYSGDGKGSGCSGPGNKYAKVIDQGGQLIHWHSYMENNPNWQVVGGATHCIQHLKVVPEPITSVQATAQLSPESRSWILNDLAGKYYDAYIHHATFNLVPQMASMNGACGSSGVCSASATISKVPMADPGTFDLKLWANTSGAILHLNGLALPISQPRVLYQDNQVQVFVTLLSLVPAGQP